MNSTARPTCSQIEIARVIDIYSRVDNIIPFTIALAFPLVLVIHHFLTIYYRHDIVFGGETNKSIAGDTGVNEFLKHEWSYLSARLSQAVYAQTYTEMRDGVRDAVLAFEQSFSLGANEIKHKIVYNHIKDKCKGKGAQDKQPQSAWILVRMIVPQNTRRVPSGSHWILAFRGTDPKYDHGQLPKLLLHLAMGNDFSTACSRLGITADVMHDLGFDKDLNHKGHCFMTTNPLKNHATFSAAAERRGQPLFQPNDDEQKNQVLYHGGFWSRVRDDVVLRWWLFYLVKKELLQEASHATLTLTGHSLGASQALLVQDLLLRHSDVINPFGDCGSGLELCGSPEQNATVRDLQKSRDGFSTPVDLQKGVAVYDQQAKLRQRIFSHVFEPHPIYAGPLYLDERIPNKQELVHRWWRDSESDWSRFQTETLATESQLTRDHTKIWITENDPVIFAIGACSNIPQQLKSGIQFARPGKKIEEFVADGVAWLSRAMLPPMAQYWYVSPGKGNDGKAEVKRIKDKNVHIHLRDCWYEQRDAPKGKEEDAQQTLLSKGKHEVMSELQSAIGHFSLERHLMHNLVSHIERVVESQSGITINVEQQHASVLYRFTSPTCPTGLAGQRFKPIFETVGEIMFQHMDPCSEDPIDEGSQKDLFTVVPMLKATGNIQVSSNKKGRTVYIMEDKIADEWGWERGIFCLVSCNFNLILSYFEVFGRQCSLHIRKVTASRSSSQTWIINVASVVVTNDIPKF